MKLFSRVLTKYLTRINVKRKSLFRLTGEGESPSWPEDLTVELILVFGNRDQGVLVSSLSTRKQKERPEPGQSPATQFLWQSPTL